MTLGINTQNSIKWNALGFRGYGTVEVLTNNCKAGPYANKLEPSQLMHTADFFRIDIKSRNGMNILEGGSNDPLLMAASLSQASASPNCQG